MRSFHLLLLGLLPILSDAQYQLPPEQLLADSGIRKIQIYYMDVGYFHWGDSIPISLEDTGEKYMAYELKLDEKGRVIEEDHFSGNLHYHHKTIRYLPNGEVGLDSIYSETMKWSNGYIRLKELEDGSWYYERVTHEGHREKVFADSARRITRKVYYWTGWKDSLVTEQFFDQNTRRETHYKNGEPFLIKEWKWIVKDGKPVKFILKEDQIMMDRDGHFGVTEEVFEVKEHGKLKLPEGVEETIFNTKYFKIDFNDRFLMLEPITRSSVNRHQNGLMPYSMTRNVPSFDMATRRYRYRYEYIK